MRAALAFLCGLALGLAIGLLILLPWVPVLNRELDALTERYHELLEAAMATFDLPPWVGKVRRR